MSRVPGIDASACVPRMVPWRDWDEWSKVKVSSTAVVESSGATVPCLSGPVLDECLLWVPLVVRGLLFADGSAGFELPAAQRKFFLHRCEARGGHVS